MLISRTATPHVTASEILRTLEKKRAVEQVSNVASPIMRLQQSEKYAKLFEAIMAQHDAQRAVAPPTQPAFPIEV